MTTVLHVAWRSLWRHRRRTIVTTATIGLGLAFAIFFVCLAEGIYDQLIRDAVRMHAGHVTLEHPGYRDAPAVDLRIPIDRLRRRIDRLPSVARTKPLVLGQGVARAAGNATGVSLMGVDPDVESASSPIARGIVEGRYLAEDDGARVVVGRLLAERLRLAPGKKLVIASNDARGELVEELFRVAGIFEMNAEEVDGSLVQTPLSPLQELFGLAGNEATQLGLVLRDPDEEAAVIEEVRSFLDGDPIVVRPWDEVLPELASFIRVDYGSQLVFQALLLVLVLFTIYNTILMSVLEREREYAIALAIGTPPSAIRLQVVTEAAILGLLGCATGVLLGGAAAGWVEARGWDMSSFMPEGMDVSGFAMSTRIHAKVTLETVGMLTGIVFGSALLLSLLPVRRATRIALVEALRGGAR